MTRETLDKNLSASPSRWQLIPLGGAFTKTFTGLLLADAIERGEVTANTKLGALLPVADVTLAEFASHRSGLSAQGMQLDETIPFLVRLQMHRNPPTVQKCSSRAQAGARKRTLDELVGGVRLRWSGFTSTKVVPGNAQRMAN